MFRSFDLRRFMKIWTSEMVSAVGLPFDVMAENVLSLKDEISVGVILSRQDR